MELTGKTIFVSGASGRLGIGLIRELLNVGAEVFAGVRTHEGAGHLIESLGGDLDQRRVIQLDVSKESDVGQAELLIRSRCDSLDGLVNLAAVSNPAHSVELKPEDFMRTFEVNCLGSFLQTLMAERLMTKGGSIVLLSSIYASVAPRFEVYKDLTKPNAVDYGMSKAGVEQLARYEAMRLTSKQIRVNAIRLGPALGVEDNTDKNLIEAVSKNIPLGRWANPHDFAASVKFLLSQDSEFMTGSVLTLDGGWTAR